VNDEPPRLADAGWMGPLLDATLVKDPAQRWSMAQVRAFLGGATDVAHAEELTSTQVLGAVPLVEPPPSRPSRRRPPKVALLAAAAVVVLLLAGLGLFALLSGPEPDGEDTAKAPAKPTTSAGTTAADQPTAAGMEDFIRDYVAAVGADPAQSWQMLTPKFQRESGGFETYRQFWDEATDGRLLSISADPEDLSVTYRVRFDNFDNPSAPTVLDLAYEDGRYLIDGERTKGFVPAG
jgi:hypothetical protein